MPPRAPCLGECNTLAPQSKANRNLSDIAEILLESAEGSFLQVGVFVGAMLVFFGYLNYMTAGGGNWSTLFLCRALIATERHL